MKKSYLLLALLGSWACAAPAPLSITVTPTVVASSTTLLATGVGSSSTTTPSGGGPFTTGYSQYLTHIHIEMYATGTLTGGATPVKCFTLGLPTQQFFLFPTAAATGTTTVIDIPYDNPVQGNPGSIVNLTCPGAASVLWNIALTYFTSN